MLFTKGHQDLAFPPTRGSFTQALSPCFDPLIPKTTVLRGEITAARAASSSGFLTAQPPASTGLLGGSLPTTILPKSRTESACVGLLPNPARRRFSLVKRGATCVSRADCVGPGVRGSVVMLQNHREPERPKRRNLRDTRTVHYFVGIGRPPIYVVLGGLYVAAMLAAALYLLFIAE